MPQITKAQQQPADDEESDGSEPMHGLVSSSDGSVCGDDATMKGKGKGQGTHKPVDVSSEENDSDDAGGSEDEEESEDECSDVEVPNLNCAACGKMSQEVLTSVG